MKKEEFPTFLNEQPTVIFGRTGRELIILACGAAIAYRVWSTVDLSSDFISLAVHVVLTGLPVLIAFFFAVISIAGRPLEEWTFVLLLYLFVPKLYQYVPFETEESSARKAPPSRERRPGALESDEEDD